MSSGKLRPGSSNQSREHSDEDQRTPGRPFSLPLGYYDYYGIPLPKGAVQAKRSLFPGQSLPLGYLEYYGIVQPATSNKSEDPAPPKASQAKSTESTAQCEADTVKSAAARGTSGNQARRPDQDVQAKSAALNTESEAVHEAARRGTSGPSEPLPHLGEIQKAFGHHDVIGVQAHNNSGAQASARAMGAEAFTTGNHVAFAGAPSLHTAAHEAAHVIQQRAGVQLKGGVGELGDEYERKADAVADRVVAGQSAEALLDETVGIRQRAKEQESRGPDRLTLEDLARHEAGRRPTGGGTGTAQSVALPVRHRSDRPTLEDLALREAERRPPGGIGKSAGQVDGASGRYAEGEVENSVYFSYAHAQESVAAAPAASAVATSLVQAKRDEVASKRETDQVQDAAAHGTSGPSGPLPFLDPIERPAPAEQEVVAAIQERGDGAPLTAEVQDQFSGAYGTDLSGVRIHNDVRSNQAADGAGAEAFSYGKDVFFGTGRYDTSSDHGRFVLGHELAHVAQQKDGAPKVLPKVVDGAAISRGSEHDPEEREANTAAQIALAGGTVSIGRGPARVRRFAQGSTSDAKGGHAAITRHALRHMGLEDRPGDSRGSDVDVARMGNWERDLSQAITPTTAGFIQVVMPILNIIAIKEFGRGINIQSFGTYDPIEHLDNPANLRGSDVLAQGGMVDSRGDVSGGRAGANPDNAASASSGQAPGTLGGTAGRADQAYADIEERYRNAPGFNKHRVLNPEDAAAFQVDQSGIPRYMQASRQWLTETLRTAGRLGRQQNIQGDERLHGPRLFASGTHTLQDYYAHSNFCEIAINILIREGQLRVMNDRGQMESVDAARVLNTQVHANDEHGNAVAGNLATGSLHGGGREVLTTGTFNLTDTVASILEEVGDKWKALDPFKEKPDQPSPLIMAVMDYIDMNPQNPTDFSQSGRQMAVLFDETIQFLRANMTTGAQIVEGAGNVAETVTRNVTGFTGGLLSRTGRALGNLGDRANGRVGGWLNRASSWMNDGGQQVREAGASVAHSIDRASDNGGQVIQQIIQQLNAIKQQIDTSRQHRLRGMYVWLHEHGPLKLLEERVKRIPIVGEKIAPVIRTLRTKIRTVVEGIFASAWNGIVTIGVSGLNSAIARIRASTNVQNKRRTPTGPAFWQNLSLTFGNVSDFYDQATGQPRRNAAGKYVGIAPGTYAPPSHTEVAKDHQPVHNAAGTHHHHDQGEQGGHTHEGAWLNLLAQELATRATDAVGRPVARCWDKADQQGTLAPNDPLLDAIAAEVDRWFRHPADCTYWRAPTLRMLGGHDLGPQLLAHLRNAHAGTPDTPSFFPQPDRPEPTPTPGGQSHPPPTQ